MGASTVRFTRADYDRVPEDLRVELIDGQLLKMASPTVLHQQVARRLVVALLRHVGQERLFFGPIDFAIDEHNVLVPDVVVLAKDAIPGRGARDINEADLVAEVLSPSTAARDRTVKTDLYLGAGVREIWLVDPRKRAVEVRTAAGTRLVRAGETVNSLSVPGAAFDPAELFA